MNRNTILIIILLFCISCNSKFDKKEEINNDLVLNELQLNTKYIFNLHAQLKDKSLVTRELREDKIAEDTIFYILNRDNLYESNTAEYFFYVKFSIKDIDQKFEINRHSKSVKLKIFPKNDDSTKFEYGKFQIINGNFEYGWSGFTGFITVDFPVDLETINSDFDSYYCYFFGKRTGMKEKVHMTLDYVKILRSKSNIESSIIEGLENFMKMINSYNSKLIIDPHINNN